MVSGQQCPSALQSGRKSAVLAMVHAVANVERNARVLAQRIAARVHILERRAEAEILQDRFDLGTKWMR
jgi:hypothetical protein